ncbi:unnamed protein product [Adineta ricciae]|uniref:Uncharacterized protein n=1 Tax=Adineta ricciae TaxID=249248 RepID=A0A815TFH8_ADIRI|nr:unnamed protein product [Adineta ricciae]CAF1612273.1 unnamed protein product [Adineta ricciae]
MGPLQFDNPSDELEYFLKTLEKDSIFNMTTNQVPIAIAHETDEIAIFFSKLHNEEYRKNAYEILLERKRKKQEEIEVCQEEIEIIDDILKFIQQSSIEQNNISNTQNILYFDETPIMESFPDEFILLDENTFEDCFDDDSLNSYLFITPTPPNTQQSNNVHPLNDPFSLFSNDQFLSDDFFF